MSFRGGQFRQKLILNISVFIVSVLEGQYKEELILNVTVFFVSVLKGNIARNSY